MATEAKRRLSDISFAKEGCHVSLVGKSVGGAANGRTTLVLKSLSPQGINQGIENAAPAGDNKEGNKMTTEMIEKSAVELMVQKAVQDAVSASEAVYKSKLAAIEAAQLAVVHKSRLVRLEAAIGTETLEGTFNAIKGLDDGSFDIVLKGFESARIAEAKSPMFTEKGAVIKDEPKDEVDMVTKMAARFAKEFAAK